MNTSQEEACSISVIESLACGFPSWAMPEIKSTGEIPAGRRRDRPSRTTFGNSRTRSCDGLVTPTACAPRGLAPAQLPSVDSRFRALCGDLWEHYESIARRR